MSDATFETLLAPLGADAFFNEYWERAPLHLSGDRARGHALLTHDALLDALTRHELIPSQIVAFPEYLDDALEVERLVRDRALLSAYLDAGHPLVWNGARGVSPSIDALAASLAEALGAHVWPNVYATGSAGTPFDAHFDAHEVFAVQCEGRKQWWISEVRVNRPLDVEAMASAVTHELKARRDEALSRTRMTFTASPGDVVYLPRGVFHNASTPAGRSLHVTFGVRLPTGYDAFVRLAHEALSDPAMREYLTPLAADPEGARAGEELDALVERLRAGVTVERVSEALATVRAAMVARSRSADAKR